jgi:GTP-binding protein
LALSAGAICDKVLETAWRIKEEREKRIPTAELNRAIERIVTKSPPPFYGGGNGKIFYATQVGRRPPTVAIFTSAPTAIHPSYHRYLQNQITDAFRLSGTTVRVQFRGRR